MQVWPDINSTRGAVIVTGASSGIGAAITRRLVETGFHVFGSVRTEQDAIPLTESLGTRFHPLIFDVRDAEAVTRASHVVQHVIGDAPIKGLVNNAGVATFGPMECLDDQAFEASIQVNLIGTRRVINAFLPMLRSPETGGSPGKIINISSLSGILNTPMNGAYCVAKHALESLGEIYRRELLADGIDVVSIRSGPVQSEIWRKSGADAPKYAHHPYQQMSDKARSIMKSAEGGAIPASVIAKAVEQILERKRNRPAYHFSRGAFVARVLAAMPPRWADRLIVRGMMKNTTSPNT